MVIEKTNIALENLEMSKSYNPHAWLNFHNIYDKTKPHILKTSMNLSLVPPAYICQVNQNLQPLIINLHEQISHERYDDVYCFGRDGRVIAHTYTEIWPTGGIKKENYSGGCDIGRLLKHKQAFTEALSLFQGQMNREFVHEDPRQIFVDRIKKINGLIGKF